MNILAWASGLKIMSVSRGLIIMAAALFFSCTGYAQDNASLEKLPPSVMKASILNLDGTSFRLAEGKGKVKIVLLWASWCGPCWLAADALNKVHADYLRREVEIVGLTPENPRTDRRSVRKFIRTHRIRFKIGWADEEMAKLLIGGHPSVPQIIVVTNDGRIIKRLLGYNPNPETTLKQLSEAVESQMTEGRE